MAGREGIRKRRRETTLEDLPQDLLEKVLSWLPASSFCRLRSVCKKWRSVESSPSFLRSCSTVPSRDPWFLMASQSDSFSSSVFFDSGELNWKTIPRPALLQRCNSVPVASAGGLVCFFSAAGAFAVCNPLTGSCRELPGEHDKEKIHAIAMTASPSSYRLFLISGDFPGNARLKIYDSGEQRWEESSLFSGPDVDLAGGGEMVYFLSKEGEVMAAKTQRSSSKKYSAVMVGEKEMFFLSPSGAVVGCDLARRSFAELPRLLPANVEHSFDVVECAGEMMVVALSKLWESASLRVWRFCGRERRWRQAAAMPPAMAWELGEEQADVNCVGVGAAILVCVSSGSCSRHFFCDVAAERWSELPYCGVGGAPAVELRSAFSFEPRLEALV